MPFRRSPVTARVPATSANLGPGFDSLGLALSLHDTVTARVGGSGVRVTVSGEGADELPGDEGHLVAGTMLTTFDRLGGRPEGLLLDCHNAIPQARGMGSSSAAIVAGILLARRLVDGGGDRLDDAAALRLAAEIEGHPDNVAPCLLGGITIAWTGPGGARAVRLAAGAGVVPVVFVPGHHGYTAHARAVLPESVPLADAVFNAARTALLTHALGTGAADLLLDATQDRLHQDYRAAAMPETAKLVATLRGRGIAAVVSGAGPSVLAIVPDDPRRIADAEQQCPDGWWARTLSVAPSGAVVTDSTEG
jgi:homoserine kinase